ncbi:proepiregulin isoform X1 [Esox lucius]|nr:proepiregulin isoform X1 [Esox lucius]
MVSCMTHLNAVLNLQITLHLRLHRTMRNTQSSVLLAFIGLLLVVNGVHATGLSSSTQQVTQRVPTSQPLSPCKTGTCPKSGEEQTRPWTRIGRGMFQKCDSSQESYCLNGECFLVPDINEHHCRCDKGYYGPRCAHLEMVFQPMREEHVILMVVFVGLLVVGITGAVYFFCQWYRRSRCPTQQTKQLYQVPTA